MTCSFRAPSPESEPVNDRRCERSDGPRGKRVRAIDPGAAGSVAVTSGTPDAQVRSVRGPDRPDSQADSAGSTPVTRSATKTQVSGHQPWRGRLEKTYAAPWKRLVFTVAPGAPAATVPPEIATDVPSRSREPPSEAVSFAVWVPSVHLEPGFTNRYAAPCEALAATVARSAPATTVSPEIATDNPSRLTEAPSEAVSFAVWVRSVHPEPGLTNTYAVPCSVLAPTVASGAPTTIVLPEIATAKP